MKQIKTKDGSLTCYSEKFKENYHSVSGAFEEAFKKYIEPCKVKDGLKILDICFGLGYNSAAALYKAKKLEIVALENDEEVLNEIKKINVPIDFENVYSIIRKVAENKKYEDENVKIKVLLGDARKTIQKINEKFNAVFLDPFSTLKNPELWTVEFFKEIKKRMKDNAILATYSSSVIVRNGLLEAGFKIGNGPVVGRLRPCTLASIKAKLPSMTKEDKKLIRVFGEPFHDFDLSLKREEILKRRNYKI